MKLIIQRPFYVVFLLPPPLNNNSDSAKANKHNHKPIFSSPLLKKFFSSPPLSHLPHSLAVPVLHPLLPQLVVAPPTSAMCGSTSHNHPMSSVVIHKLSLPVVACCSSCRLWCSWVLFPSPSTVLCGHPQTVPCCHSLRSFAAIACCSSSHLHSVWVLLPQPSSVAMLGLSIEAWALKKGENIFGF